ncbi:Lon protease family protein [Sphaerotilus microaerophilus]|uniref:endopeptidase La n=1 Tax=Sphaerotilus microaerophilus TaxID=2914710 RepID=A0ABM7YRP0_9BURK|nr:ATP-binding protein [Sphaerotilus sp. FB-5]BDI07243.1 ATP-dependent protease [Sphaerotilus sp. FB-5]
MPAVSLPPAALRLTIDPASLPFADTAELIGQPLPWIGQERAEQAARFGLTMQAPDYHLFVLGEVGTGRSTLMQQMMREVAASRPVPPDLVYLHHFENPEQPRALRLPAGEGRLLRQLMGDFAKTLHEQIPKRLASPEAKAAIERIEAAAQAEDERTFVELAACAEAHHFALLREEGHFIFTQRDEAGEPLTAAKVLTLSLAQRAANEAAEAALRAEIAPHLEAMQVRELAKREALAALRRQMVKPLLEHALQAIRAALRKQIKDGRKLAQYLDGVQADVLDNLALFQPAAVDGDVDEAERVAGLMALTARLRVNVVVDHAEAHHAQQGAPVIVDDNPTWRSLFGSIEYESENDVLVTDFSRIRAGSLLKAHGGFLLLHLRDLMSDPQVWEKLRRFLRSGRLQIEEPGLAVAPISAVSLQPEPVDVQVKIVLIASVEEYYLVQEGDPEFARRFRCKVDFAESFGASPGSYLASAIFVAQLCEQHGLPQASAAAVAALIEATHREAEDQRRQSALFGRTEALLLEAAALAQARGAARVAPEDLLAARQAQRHRHDYPEQRLQESIVDGERLIAASGERVGQVNGLTVVDPGDHAFGFPVRVTARSHAGEEGLLDIQREVEMAGPIHSKGVLILHSHLAALFAHIAPLAMNGSVVFEQEYSGVEGDSASCAEFYALLSSLAGTPLRQGIAVTGAINQHGEMLPVGGINEKVEGWFRTCEGLGLDGRQGVLIPARNAHHLMLDERVVEAVAAGRFHLYTADSAAEGMELLTGLAYGALEHGSYPPGTVLGRAQRTLQAYRRACEGPDEGHAGRGHRHPGGVRGWPRR